MPSAFAPDNNHIMLNLFLIPPAASHLLCFISKYHRIQEHVVRVVKRRRAKQIVKTDRQMDGYVAQPSYEKQVSIPPAF